MKTTRSGRVKECGECEFVYGVKKEYIVDVGTAFGAEFRYACPKCGSTKGIIKAVK